MATSLFNKAFSEERKKRHFEGHIIEVGAPNTLTLMYVTITDLVLGYSLKKSEEGHTMHS